MSRFAPVPKTPNCVSSRADPGDREHYIAPLAGTSLEAVKADMLSQTRTELVEEAEGYLHFVTTTLILRFKDDVEFEAEGDLVHVRSASRIGHSDLGVNRKRVEALRDRLG
jgi:uncharacterized protein (DUF1499 family)